MNLPRALYFTAALAVPILGSRSVAPATSSVGQCECYFVGDLCVSIWPFCKPVKVEKPKVEPAPCPAPPQCDPSTQSCPT